MRIKTQVDFRLSNIQNQIKDGTRVLRELGSQEYYVQSNCHSNTKAVISCHIGTVIVPTSWGLAEKVMAPHSSTLAWKIPGMEEPGGLQSMGSRRVGHD